MSHDHLVPTCGGRGCWLRCLDISHPQGDCKRMLFRDASGAVRERQLYRVEINPREQEFEFGDKQPAKANELQKRLLDYLTAVNGETSPHSSAKPKRKRPVRQPSLQ